MIKRLLIDCLIEY